jgi:hypothetical protein
MMLSLVWVMVSSGAAGVALADSVRDFGAVGDGATDDTASIERAIAETSSGEIQFPRGDYRITRTIEIALSQTGRISLDGLGGVGRVIMAGSGPAFRFVGTHRATASPEGFTDLTWQHERMPQVIGLEILGNHPEADGIEFVRVMQPTLLGVLIREVRNGVVMSTRNRNLLIDSCHIYNCSGIGVFFDHVNLHQANIHGSHISYCMGGGIKIVDGEIRNFQITGNDIEYNFDPDAEQSADIWIEIPNGTVAEGTISGNTIQAKVSPGGANIRFVGPESAKHPTPMSMWTISGNVIGSQMLNMHLVRCRGMAITGNHIYSGLERNLVLDDCQNIVVGTNSLDQSHSLGRGFSNGITVRNSRGVTMNTLVLDDCAAGTETAGGAVEIFDSREVTIKACQIANPHVRGIWASGTRNLQIVGNTLVQDTGTSAMIAAIEIQQPTGTTLIRDNLVAKGTKGDVVADDPNVHVRGNESANETGTQATPH